MLCENYLKPLFLSKPVIAELGKADPTGGYKLQSFQEPSVETLVLVPSERCNLCCTYCYEQHKHSQRMDIQTAKVAVRSAFSNLGPCKRLKIEFRGGEPFLEFDFIKEVCDWVIKEYPAGLFSFYAITNGTCFSDEVKQWLLRHKERFVVALSIDGDRTTQNRNRSDSFDLIDFDFLFETWTRPCCVTTILPENSLTVFRDLRFVMDKGFDVRVNFGYVQEWSFVQLAQLARGFKRFADYALGKRYANRINLLSRYNFLDYSFVQDEAEPERRRHFLACNAGKYRRLVAADGKAYPCQAFVPSAFNWCSGSAAGNLFDKLKTEELHPSKCCTCRFFYLCHICPGFSYGYAGSFRWRNPSLCAVTKIRTFLASYYWGNRMRNRTNRAAMGSDNAKMTMSAIAALYHGEKIYE